MSEIKSQKENPLALRRAAHALEQIKSLEKNGKTANGNYVSYAKALPAEILQMGLGQAMATLLAAAGGKQDAHRMLYDHVEAWLCGKDADSPYPGEKDIGLMEAIVTHNEDVYLHAQAEALAYLEWLKKFAVAFLDQPKGDE